MPITPFHFGPGLAIHAAMPKRVSFMAFCAANILIDCEPLYYMITDQAPLHRFFHSLLGASVVIALAIGLIMLPVRLASTTSLPNLFGWKQLSLGAVTLGAILGGYSHVALDCVMHADVRPFAPFSNANPLLDVISLTLLHAFCAVMGILGLALYGHTKNN